MIEAARRLEAAGEVQSRDSGAATESRETIRRGPKWNDDSFFKRFAQ